MIVVALALAAIVIVVAQTGITRRLRTLASNLEQFRQADDHSMAPRCEVGDEIDQVRCAAQTLQQRVVDQFKRIEDAERLRPELISNISRDLHTPLANIQGYVETLLVRGDHLSRVEREQYLRTSLQHCRSLSRRVAELFELSKPESGRAQISAEPFCMAELLNDVVQSYALNAESRGICVRLSDDANRQARVRADIALIERVLQNLVDNALRHTPSGGHVELSVDAAGALVRVSVRDSGQGIDAADLPHIFERYWTGGSTSGHASDCDPSRTSAGLGLAIARLIVELHGCQIGVRSAPQRGTEFSFALPVAAGSG